MFLPTAEGLELDEFSTQTILWFKDSLFSEAKTTQQRSAGLKSPHINQTEGWTSWKYCGTWVWFSLMRVLDGAVPSCGTDAQGGKHWAPSTVVLVRSDSGSAPQSSDTQSSRVSDECDCMSSAIYDSVEPVHDTYLVMNNFVTWTTYAKEKVCSKPQVKSFYLILKSLFDIYSCFWVCVNFFQLLCHLGLLWHSLNEGLGCTEVKDQHALSSCFVLNAPTLD